MTRFALFATLLVVPGLAIAAGSEPPKSTQSNVNCARGQVYDERTKTCVVAQDSRLTDEDRLDAAYDLAHGGRPEDALLVLAAHGEQNHPDVLTLKGFATRKAGDWDAGIALYQAALAIDSDHWQARSYLGMGLAERGKIAQAEQQLRLIRASGGRGSYPERQLAAVLRTGESTY